MTERPLPPRLSKQIASASRDTRLRAVGELVRLIAGTHPGRAAAARAALQNLAGDDSRSVAEAATAALAGSSFRLEPSRIDFGRVPPGTPRLVAEVVVGGPPRTRPTSVASSRPDLRATLTGDHLRVAWLPGAGALDGSVTLTGPAGTTAVPVTGEVAAGPLSDAALAGRAKAAASVGTLRTHGPVGREVPSPRNNRRGAIPIAAGAVLLLLVGLGVLLESRSGSAPGAAPRISASPAAPAVRPVLARALSVAQPTTVATLQVGTEPEGVAVSPDSRTVYVANQGSRILSVIDVASGAVVPVTLRNTARFVAVSRDGRHVFVSMYEQDKTGSGVAVVDAATRTVIKYLATGVQPYDLAVAPDGRLWVPIHGGARVDIFAAGDERPAGQVRVPENPHSVGFAADGQRAFTPDHESNSVSVIDMRTDRRVRSIPVSSAPHNLDVSPDGRTVVVACFKANAVDLIDAVTLVRRGPFPVGHKPQSVAISTDGAYAYVVNEADNTVSVVATSTGAVTSTVAVGRSPRTVAVAPDGRRAYVTNGDENTVTVLAVATQS